MQLFSTTFVFVLNLHLNVLNVHEQTFCSSFLVISWLNEVHYLKNSLRSHGCRVSLFENFLFLFPRALILKGPLGDTNSLGYTLLLLLLLQNTIAFFSFQCFLKFLIPQVFSPLLKFLDSQVLQISFQSQELKRFSRIYLGVLISLGINFPRYPMGCYFILCIQLFLFLFFCKFSWLTILNVLFTFLLYYFSLPVFHFYCSLFHLFISSTSFSYSPFYPPLGFPAFTQYPLSNKSFQCILSCIFCIVFLRYEIILLFLPSLS